MKSATHTVRRILSILLTLCMVVSAIPVTAHAEYTAYWPAADTDASCQTDFSLKSPIQDRVTDQANVLQSEPQNASESPVAITALTVDGTDALTTSQGSGWHFDKASGILTLSGASISGISGFGILAEGDLTIELAPDTQNTVSGSACGISVAGSLTIRGDNLSVNGTGADAAGIYASGLILIESCPSLTVSGRIMGIFTGASVTVQNSNLTVSSTCTEAEIMSRQDPGYPSALYAQYDLTVDSSTITVTGNLIGINAYNLYANDSTLSATAGYFGILIPFVSIQNCQVTGIGTVPAQSITPNSYSFFSSGMNTLQAKISGSDLNLQGGFVGLFTEGEHSYVELLLCDGNIIGGFVGMLTFKYAEILQCNLTIDQTMTPDETQAYSNIFGAPCPPAGIYVVNQGGYMNMADSELQVSHGVAQLGADLVSLSNVRATLQDGCYGIMANTSVGLVDCPEFIVTYDYGMVDAYNAQGMLPFPPSSICCVGQIYLSGCDNTYVDGFWMGLASMDNTVLVENSYLDVSGGYAGIMGMYIALDHVSGTARGSWTPQEAQAMGAPATFGLLSAAGIELTNATLSAGQIGIFDESVYTVLDSQNQPLSSVGFVADEVEPPAPTDPSDPSEPEVTEPETDILAEGTCGANLTWVLTDQGVLTISGQGEMTDYANNNAPWFPYRYQIQSVVMEEGVTHIGNGAFMFMQCSPVTIPSSVTSIGSMAFFSNATLTSIELPEGLLTIGDAAFSGCGLTQLTLPESLNSIGESAFSNNNLTTITIPANVETIGTSALQSPGMTAILVDEANEKFCSHDGILYENQTLVQVPAAYTGAVVPVNDTVMIGHSAFANCPYVEEVTIPARIREINGFAFANCTALRTVHFQGDLPVFSNPFLDLTVTVEYPAANTTWRGAEQLSTWGGTITFAPYGTDLVAYGNCGEYEMIGNGMIAAPCGDNATWELTSDGTLTISGTGKTTDCYLTGNHPWLTIAQNDSTRITRVVVEEGITYLGSFSFLDFIGENITELVLPSTLTEFGHAACYGMTALESVTIPDGITALSTYVFSNCTALTELDIPASVTTVREGALSECRSLIRIRFLGDAPAIAANALTGVTSNAFYPTGNTTWTSDLLQNYGGTITWNSLDPSLLGEGTCGEGVTWTLDPGGRLTISGQGDMDDYSSENGQPWHDLRKYITSVYVEGTVNSIGAYSFYGLPNLTSVVIGEGVTEIGGHSMRYCPKLSSVLIPATVTEVGSSAFAESTLLVSAGPVGSGCNVQFSWTESIPDDAFNRMSQLSHVVLPEGLLSIGDGAFLYCISLTSIDLPEGLIRIGSQAFESTGLAEITFPDTVTEIGSEAFEYCPLVEVVLPANLQTVSAKMFNSCSELTTVTIPAGVTEIGLRAFWSCDSLETVRFEGDAPTFSSNAFDSTTVNAFYPAANTTWTRDKMQNYQGSITWIGYSDASEVASGWSGYVTWVLTSDGALIFSGQGNMKSYSNIADTPWYPYLDQIHSVVLNPGVTTISDNAFLGCQNLERIILSDSVTSIGNYAFKGCVRLNHAVLPNGLTQLGESAFYGCTSLTSIEIPASLYTVKPYTFKNCVNLTSVTFHEGNLQKISDGAFYGTGLTELVLPNCLEILDMYSFKGCANLSSVTIGSGLTELREAVFYGTAITSISIPYGITKIGPYAFKNCVNLESVDFPRTLISVGEASFYACTALRYASLPDSVTEIGNYAFRKCEAIRSLYLSKELVTIGEAAFYGCSRLGGVVIPDKVTTIKPYAFKTCTGLTSVTLGSSVETIGEGAFNTCTGIKTIVFPASLKTIGDYCFSGSEDLWKLTFEGDAPSIGTGAFKSLDAYGYYPAGNATWTSANMLNYGGKIIWKAK